MKKLTCIVTFWLLGISCGFAQSYHGLFDNFFLRQQANAQAEAMGQGHVTMTGSPFSVFYNPASSSFSDGITTEFSRLDPSFYQNTNSHTNSYGISYNTNKYGAFAFNEIYYTDNLDHAGFQYIRYIHSIRSKLDIFNYSYKFHNDLGIGININYLWNDYFIESDNAVIFDLGGLKRFAYKTDYADHVFLLGASYNNIMLGNIQNFRSYPAIARIGASYEFDPKIKISNYNAVQTLLSMDYRFVTNSSRAKAFQLGTEFTLFETLKLRGGYYNENVNTDYELKANGHLANFTWGAGINIPINKLLGSQTPIRLQFDFANLKNPGYYFASSLYNTEAYSKPSAYYSIYSLKLNVGI
jgi:hypothetical protein